MITAYERNTLSTSTSISGGFVTTATELILRVLKTHKERHQLSNLSEAQLQDIGISKSDAIKESKRTLLDLPAHRW